MPNDIANNVPQTPAPQPHRTKRKFTDAFRAALTEIKHALDDEGVAAEPSAGASAPPVPGEAESGVSVEEVLAAGEQMDQDLQHLQRQHQTLGNQVDTVLRLSPEEQKQLVKLMWQTMEQMEASLTRVQEAHFALQRTLREKRLLLVSTKEELRKSVERDTAQLETITTLRQDNARLTREQQVLQHQGVRHQEELGHLQKQYDALVKQHDELAGAHHQLFQRYNLAQRKETR
jgi:hypothetical protein